MVLYTTSQIVLGDTTSEYAGRAFCPPGGRLFEGQPGNSSSKHPLQATKGGEKRNAVVCQLTRYCGVRIFLRPQDR